MAPELLIFVGYSQDAKDEARAICELKPLLQDVLKHLNQVASSRSTYSTLDMFNWEADADVVIGGQSSTITPHLERAAIAVFVFKERIGRVTREELSDCRNRPTEKRIPTLALFCSAPPPPVRLTNREGARGWADLLDRRNELTEDWTHQDSRSVTPLEYRDVNHLKDTLMKKIEDLLPSLILGNDATLPVEQASSQPSSQAIPSNYLDSATSFVQFDSKAVQQYRSLMRSSLRLTLPQDLPDKEFLRRDGYLRGGTLTIAGALLFTSSPSRVIPSALLRCSKYDGDNKATSRDWHNCDGPILNQILEARDFIATNIGRKEQPVESSMRSSTTYEYPMVCIREVLANAVCHRNYEDQERLIYVTIYSNRIEIKSPGSWCSIPLPEGKPVPLTQLIGESVQRNMRLAHAISSVGMMEVEGSGIPTAVNDCIDCESPMPSVEQRDGYVIVTIYPTEGWDPNAADTSGDSFVDAVPGVRQSSDLLPTVKRERGDETPEGRTLRTIGAELDITERKEAEEALRRAHEEISKLKNQLQEENIYLQEEIKLAHNVDEIIGRSNAIKYVLFKIEQVAQTDTTVMILGETGTGKELVARAIHNQSLRKDRPLVKVNCAALSAGLIESELFGHEKGSFTGAAARKIGRFELADGATLFLDEIGELPPDLQSKLLRVIQEGEFERLGSSRTIKVDVRIIVATNRDMKAEVAKGSFREDLWYRLNVFPITVPPLRQRKEDIPPMVEHFVSTLSRRVGKDIIAVSSATLKKLQDYSWPGNVRELANVIERAVIFADGPVLQIVGQLEQSPSSELSPSPKSLLEIEKEYITRILDESDWKISGPNGAAKILGLSPKTLRARMKKLTIAMEKATTKGREG